MEELIKLLFIIGIPLICIWAANGCYKIMEYRVGEVLMEEIQIGEYIRTKYDGIKKIREIEVDEGCVYYYYNDIEGLWEEDILEHSFNLLDLIKVGDYVNGVHIEEIQVLKGKKCLFYDLQLPMEVGLHFFMEKDIKSILTKEQFKQAEYRVEMRGDIACQKKQQKNF